MEAYNESYWHQPDPGDNWRTETTHLEQAELELRRQEGVDKLEALDYKSQKRVQTNIGGYIEGAYPDRVFDAVEVFINELYGDARGAFCEDINQVFAEEETPWRIVDETVVKLDTSMLDAGVVDHAVDVLKAMNLEGALDEFRDALDELGDDPRDAIQDACNSFESVLKAATGATGDATALINSFLKDYAKELPAEQRKAMKQVLQALPILGNNLGRHGQGPEIVEVKPRYAKLAVHLAGAFILFAVDALTEGTNTAKPAETPSWEWDGEAPF